MCHFWQAGAETMENVTFGERSLEEKVGEAQGRALEGHGIPGRFKALLVRQVLFLVKKWGRTADLTNNNIYIYICI